MRLLSALRAGHRSGGLYLGLSAASAVGAAGLALSAYQEGQENERLQKEFDLMLAKERAEATRQEAARAKELKDVRSSLETRGVLRSASLETARGLAAEAFLLTFARLCPPLMLMQAPALWSGTLTNADRRLQGHVMLRNVKIGAAVEVLEDNQGPGERYLTLRDVQTGAVGWYPKDWVSEDARQ